VVPDRQIIMQVKLTGAGYEQNAICAKKFNVLYALCEQQLSKQAHYDFGLRNILAVLRTCGSSKRDFGKDPGGAAEPMLVMRTLRDMNLSKYVAEDVPLFLALIEDLFPGLKAAKMQHPLVEPASRKAVRDNNLQEHPDWINKIIQVYEMCLVRHSLMLVGPSGTGKSKIITCLQQAFQAILVPPGELVQPMIGQPQKFMTLNPKAILSGQMFGKSKQEQARKKGRPSLLLPSSLRPSPFFPSPCPSLLLAHPFCLPIPSACPSRHDGRGRRRVERRHLRAALASRQQGQEELHLARARRPRRRHLD